ncbi:MAG: zeta toxin family protein, partial [Ruminococcus sp.]|nr:zeta toxin family protein [Ruminococcus sp.]
MKEYVIFAGASGAGKSTLYNLPDTKNPKRLNIDEILADDGGEPANPNEAYLARRKGMDILETNLQDGVSICQETTLTDSYVLSVLKTAYSRGYNIKMYYVGLESADIAVSRVLQRVIKGGYGLAEKQVRQKYDESLKNLKEIAKVCDEIYVFDNTEVFKLIA